MRENVLLPFKKPVKGMTALFEDQQEIQPEDKTGEQYIIHHEATHGWNEQGPRGTECTSRNTHG
jgi:hypothetical protein